MPHGFGFESDVILICYFLSIDVNTISNASCSGFHPEDVMVKYAVRALIISVLSLSPGLAQSQQPQRAKPSPVAKKQEQSKPPAPAKPTQTEAARLEAACDAKDSQACFDLAFLHWSAKATGWVESKRGSDAFDKGIAIDAAKTVASQEQRCAAENARACTTLAMLYQDGQGVTKDAAKAAAFFQKACEAGDAWGCLNLGYLLDAGSGVTQDKARAFEFFQKGCEADLPTGCLDVANTYFIGKTVAKDQVKSTSFYQRACDGGYARGCFNAAVAYGEGLGVAKDDVRATEMYQRACDHGHGDGCANLGFAYYRGNGVAKDAERAAALYEKGCGSGSKQACSNFWALHQERQGARNINCKGISYKIGGLQTVMPAGAEVVMTDVVYVGRHFNVAVPTGGGGIKVSTASVTALDASGTPQGQPLSLQCQSSQWNDKTRRAETACSDASMNIELQVLPVGIGGAIITTATCIEASGK
jgi:uncharacterized protein